MGITTINPATEEILATFEPYNQEKMDRLFDQSRQAFVQWSTTPLEQRARALQHVAKYLRDHQADLARLAVLEMGKPITEAKAEVEKCAWNCDYFAENAHHFLADEHVNTNATESYVSFRPLGVLLAIMPWNFPYWQVLRFAAPALIAGNTIVLKHASNVSLVALEIERLFQECDLPQGVFSTLLLPGSQAKQLVEDPRITAVTLTGSETAGIEVATISGHALKKQVLELGGSDAFVVLEDADVQKAAEMAVTARFLNTGQSCIAAKRFLVADAVAEKFERTFVEATAKLRVGNPLDDHTQIGPMARDDLREALDKQIQASVNLGARILLGGKPLEGKGYFYAPTIVTDVTPEMPMFSEETFGPAAAITHVRDTNHAIALTNTSKYGLSCNLWTSNIEKGRELASRIETGSCFLNSITTSDPRLPFGGIKRSGFGRELSSFGIREFVNIQTVWIGPNVEKKPPRVASQ